MVELQSEDTTVYEVKVWIWGKEKQRARICMGAEDTVKQIPTRHERLGLCPTKPTVGPAGRCWSANGSLAAISQVGSAWSGSVTKVTQGQGMSMVEETARAVQARASSWSAGRPVSVTWGVLAYKGTGFVLDPKINSPSTWIRASI